MKAIFVSDANPAYLEFWEPHARHLWTKFGLRSLLYYIAAAPDTTLFTSDYAEVKHVPLVPSVPAIVQALVAKWYFPGYETADRLFICDIDCLLLSKRFLDAFAQSTSFMHMQLLPNGNFPGYYVAGSPSQFRTFFRTEGLTFEGFCKQVLQDSASHSVPEHHVSEFSKSATPDWKYFGLEEHYGGLCARLSPQIPIDATTRYPSPSNPTTRICRSFQSWVDPACLARGDYIDYHCPRPYSQYASLIQSILSRVTYAPLSSDEVCP